MKIELTEKLDAERPGSGWLTIKADGGHIRSFYYIDGTELDREAKLEEAITLYDLIKEHGLDYNKETVLMSDTVNT